MSIPIAQFIPPPPLSPPGVHTFVLYICVSISALQTGSSVPVNVFFKNIRHSVAMRTLSTQRLVSKYNLLLKKQGLLEEIDSF